MPTDIAQPALPFPNAGPIVLRKTATDGPEVNGETRRASACTPAYPLPRRTSVTGSFWLASFQGRALPLRSVAHAADVSKPAARLQDRARRGRLVPFRQNETETSKSSSLKLIVSLRDTWI